MIRNRLRKAAEDKRKISAMRRAFATVRDRQRRNADMIPDLEERKLRLRAAREYSVGNRDLFEDATERLQANGVDVRLARTREDAISLILDEIGEHRLVVKGKSNTAKELDLARALESRGIEAIETDIGDRLIQIAGERPSHHTGPASHLSRDEISRILSKHYQTDLPPDPLVLTHTIREEVRRKIKDAGIGITGANAIAAQEGAIVILHNEGNITEVAMRPGKHIVLAGVDKVYPNLEEAINMARLQTYFATGAMMTSFINLISGPSKTADIEKQLVRGVHGPQSITLILLDNGRDEIAQSEFREVLYCIGCGQCLLQCPAYFVYGNRFGDGHSLGGRGVLFGALAGNGPPSQPSAELYSCVTCGRCKKHCPVSIDTAALMGRLRRHYPSVIPEPHLEDAYRFTETHLRLLFGAARLEVLALLAAALQIDVSGPE